MLIIPPVFTLRYLFEEFSNNSYISYNSQIKKESQTAIRGLTFF